MSDVKHTHTTETIAGLRMLADNGGALAPAFIISIAERAIADYAHLQQRCEELQARIDALMLEYCPGEMTDSQIDNWKRKQAAALRAQGEST